MRAEAEAVAAAMAAAVPAHPFRCSACAASASPRPRNASGRGRARGHGRGCAGAHDREGGPRPAATRAAAELWAVRGKGRMDCQNNPVTSPSFWLWLKVHKISGKRKQLARN